MSENNTWTSTQQNRLEEAKLDEHNIVKDSHQNQKEFDVPIYENKEDVSIPIYSIPIELVSFNFSNVRIEKYKKYALNEHGIEYLDEAIEDHQGVVQKILINAKDYSQKITNDLKNGSGGLIEVGQREPALVTSTGVLWNGNRRCAVMRELFSDSLAEVGRLDRGKIKVCFLPELTPEQLRSLERRLQQDPDYKQSYGQVTVMAKIQTEINNFPFKTDEENATQDEINTIVERCKSPQFSNWALLREGKRRIDLMDEYLESRNKIDTTQNLIGNYELFESTGSVTFFEALAKLLYEEVMPWFEMNPKHGDPDIMFDKWKAMMFADLQYRLQKYNELLAVDKTEAKKWIFESYKAVRVLQSTFDKASGNAVTTDPSDTTNLILQRMEDSPINAAWDQMKSTESEDIAEFVTEKIEVEGEQVPIGKLEHESSKRNRKNFEQVGKEPAVLLQEVKNELERIVEDNLERVGPNDERITNFIRNCRDSLTELENKNNSDQNEAENNQ